MFVRIYKTIARFSPLDFTIGHGGMFTIRQRPLCRYYSTVFYFFIVLHGNATGKLIRFFHQKYCEYILLFCFDFFILLYEQYFEYIFGFRPRRRGGWLRKYWNLNHFPTSNLYIFYEPTSIFVDLIA